MPVTRVSRSVIDRYVSGNSHSGAIALAGSCHYLPLPELGRHTSVPFIEMLAGIEDPFNCGQANRAVYATGVEGRVVSERDRGHAAGVVASASAGTSEHLPTAQ